MEVEQKWQGKNYLKPQESGGFDKEDVLEQFQKLKDDAGKEKNRLQAEIREKEQKIRELNEKLEQKQNEIDRLEKDIREKIPVLYRQL